MIYDLNKIKKDHSFDSYDLIIIGSGPAGISLATKFLGTNLKVLVAEGGSEKQTKISSDIYKGEVIGDKYYDLDVTRVRSFGGSSNIWSGWCRNLDSHDFLAKKGFEVTKWPIKKSDLDPYLFEACEILQIDNKFESIFLDRNYGIKRINFNFSPPVNFGIKYKDAFKDKNLDLLLNANFMDFSKIGNKISSAKFLSYDNNKFVISSRVFVLATGGIENSRLLLSINKNHKFLFFDQNMPIGKYWMEHPHYTIGEALVPTAWKNRFLTISESMQSKLGILNCGIRFQGLSGEGIKDKIKQISCLAPRTGDFLFKLARKELICETIIRAAWEQEPVADNRIELSSNQKDRFGIPRPILYYKKNKNDLKTIRKTIEQIALYGLNKSFGRLKINDFIFGKTNYPDDDEIGGNHHMGGTRMSDNMKNGVVDKNLKIHDKENLYIAGSSVFPSGGHANPTLTIVQLSLRLADHLNETSFRKDTL